MTESTTVRTRFAPSPSGHLHVGGARTALFCWAYARKHGGKFIVRIEDTDQKRSSDAASVGFLKDLKWLGIDWDEGPEFEGCGGGNAGPYFQSERLDIYNKYIDQLIADGKAYRAFETQEELQAMREEAISEKRNFRYDRSALRLSHETVAQYLKEGRPHVVRLKLPDVQAHGPVVVHDEVRGDVVTELSELDDLVIRKADGYPMYNFAVVVDDELMNVTHVIRAAEHLSNAPKHVLIQEALGFRIPSYAHISLITNPDGSKMSKRDKDKALRAAVRERKLDRSPMMIGSDEPAVSPEHWSWWLSAKDHQLEIESAERLASALRVQLPEINVDDFRRAGYMPEVLNNYLALLGWSPGGDVEKFDLDYIKTNFELERIIRSPAKFDRDKLLAFSNDAIQAMSVEEFARLFVEHVKNYHPSFAERLSDEQLLMLGRANHPRSKTLDDQVENSRFFILNDDAIEYEQSKGVRKALVGGATGEPNGYDHLEAVANVLRDAPKWTPIEIERAVTNYAIEHAGGQLGRVAQPLRIAVSGGTISPSIFETLAILGRESTMARIDRCQGMRGSIAV